MASNDLRRRSYSGSSSKIKYIEYIYVDPYLNIETCDVTGAINTGYLPNNLYWNIYSISYGWDNWHSYSQDSYIDNIHYQVSVNNGFSDIVIENPNYYSLTSLHPGIPSFNFRINPTCYIRFNDGSTEDIYLSDLVNTYYVSYTFDVYCDTYGLIEEGGVTNDYYSNEPYYSAWFYYPKSDDYSVNAEFGINYVDIYNLQFLIKDDRGETTFIPDVSYNYPFKNHSIDFRITTTH